MQGDGEALLALAATWALVQETLRGKSRAIRYTTGALAVVLLATSPDHDPVEGKKHQRSWPVDVLALLLLVRHARATAAPEEQMRARLIIAAVLLGARLPSTEAWGVALERRETHSREAAGQELQYQQTLSQLQEILKQLGA